MQCRKPQRFLLHFGWLLLICLFSVQLQAQQKDTVTSRDLREVAVTAQSVGREVIPGQKLQADELKRLGGNSVADALRFFSGLQLKDYGGIGGLKTVDVRSMGTNQTGVFYDGIQLGNAQNGQVDLGRFSLDNMQEISLYNGQKSNIFQPAKDFASAAAIYLTTLKPSFAPGEKTHLRGTFRTGSFGLVNPAFLWQQKVNDHVTANLSAEWTNANGRYKFKYEKEKGYDTTAIRKNGDVNAFRVEGGFNGTVKNGEWSAKGYFYDSERGLPGFVVNGVFGHVDRQWDRSFFFQSSFKKAFTPKYSLLLNAKYANDYTRYLQPDTALLYVDNDYKQQEIYLSVANQYSITKWWSVALSTDFQWNVLQSYNLNKDLLANPHRYTTLIAAATAINFSRFTAQMSMLSTILNEDNHINMPYPSKQEFTPAVFLSWQPGRQPDFRLRGFYKRIFRMPTFNDVYYTPVGLSALKPEFTTQYDAGFTWYKAKITNTIAELGVDVDAYYNEVTDKIVAVPGADMLRWQMMNLGFVKIKGADLKAKAVWRFAQDLQLTTRLTYTFQKAQDFTSKDDTFYGDQIIYIPVHSGSFILGANYRLWELNFSQIYTGERYNGKRNIPENYMQPWYTSDIALARTLAFRHCNFKLSAMVNNVLNQYYDVVLSYPMPGRNYKFVLTVNL
ncbi:TonB-dependent receptor plug domain-containing protein [Chitinophaga sp. Hz27]|uniref:TonB-dependent receptor plug domain-containing protein n=1 Tax=Chitinophaga sp. Hz27 TaxID=3347169 RepID=UPI0035D5AFCC